MSILRSTLATVFLATVVTAQTAATTTSPHILVETVGPEGWRVRLGPTNLGSLLASEKGRELWEPHVGGLFAQWRHFLPDDAALTTAKTEVLSFGGRIRIAAWFREGRAFSRDVDRLVMVIESDGRSDLAPLATEVRRLQEGLRGAWENLDAAGATIEARVSGDEAVTSPIVENGCILVAMADKASLGASLAEARDLAKGATGKAPAPNTPALQVRIDTAAIVASDRELGGNRAGAQAKAAGLFSLGATTFTVGTAGPRVQVELAQSFTSDERGLFAALFPATQGVPTVRRFVDASGSWKVGRFDLSAAWRTAMAVIEADEPQREGRQSMREELKQDLGIDVQDDLLVHTTDETLLVVAPPEDAERAERTPWSFTVGLRDGAAFASALDTLLANSKPTLTKSATIDVEGGQIRRYGNFLRYDLWFATGRDVFVLAGGDDAERRLTERLAAAAKPAPTELPAAAGFDDLGRAFPPGLNGLGRGDIDSVIAQPAIWWFFGARDVPGAMAPEASEEEHERMLALVREHGLGSVRTATGYADRRWCWRLYW